MMIEKDDQTLQNIIAQQKNLSDANSQLSYNHRILSMKRNRLEEKLYHSEYDH